MFCVVVTAVFGPFFVLAPGGVGFSLYSQATRQLHAESLGGSVLLALDWLGLYDATLVAGLGIELDGAFADAVGVATSFLQLAAVATVALVYWRKREHDERLVLAFTASIAAFAIFGKTLSPQFLVWLVPLVPLVAGRVGLVATALMLVALIASQAEVHGFEGLSISGWAVWTLLFRNVVLVILLAVLVRSLVTWDPDRPAPIATLRA